MRINFVSNKAVQLRVFERKIISVALLQGTRIKDIQCMIDRTEKSLLEFEPEVYRLSCVRSTDMLKQLPDF